jgi:hypothetical protein
VSGGGGSCTAGSFMTCDHRQILFESSNKDEWEGRAYVAHTARRKVGKHESKRPHGRPSLRLMVMKRILNWLGGCGLD